MLIILKPFVYANIKKLAIDLRFFSTLYFLIFSLVQNKKKGYRMMVRNNYSREAVFQNNK